MSTGHASTPTFARVGWVLLVGLLAHGLSLGGHLVYDDLHSVRDNEAIRTLSNLPQFFVDPTMFSTKGAMYRPVVLSTLAVDHALGSGAVWAFKLGNLLFHLAASILLFRLALRLRVGMNLSFAIALAFAAHPLGSEAVHVVSSRSDQLVLIGLLWALVTHLGPRPRAWSSRIQIALATIVAVGSKETGVVVPGMLALIEAARILMRRSSAKLALQNLALPIGLAIGYLIVRKILLGQVTVAVPSLDGGADQTIGGQRNLLTQFAIMGQVLPRFLAQAVIPFGLSVDPPFDLSRSPTSVSVLCGWASVLSATAFGLWSPRKRPAVALATCGVWALALPWVLIPLNAPAGEHRVYGPLAFGLLAFGVLIKEAVRELRPRIRVSSRQLGLAVRGVAVIGLCVMSTQRAFLHLDPERLWHDALESNPRSYAAFCGLADIEQIRGIEAQSRGDSVTAEAHFRSARWQAELAAAVAPRRIRVRERIVALDLQLGEAVVAWVHARKLLELSPRHPYPRILLSRALTAAALELGRPELATEGEGVALSCLEIAEPKALVFRTAAAAAEASGDIARARDLFVECRDRGLIYPESICDEAMFELRQGEFTRARELGMELQSIAPGDPAVFQILQLASPR